LEVLGILKLGDTWYFYGAVEVIHLWCRSLWFSMKNYKTVFGAEVFLYQFESIAIVSLEMFKITIISFVLLWEYTETFFLIFSRHKKNPLLLLLLLFSARKVYTTEKKAPSVAWLEQTLS